MNDETIKDTPNQRVIKYLKYYCDPENKFDFALMLKGAWGAGKTRLIEDFLRERGQAFPAPKDLYISLYGITTFQQIEEELFRQLHPLLGSKGAKIAAAVGKGLLKTTFKVDISGLDGLSLNSALPEINLKDFVVSPEKSLLVFDDLERCSIPVADVLGYINAFVEHEHLKVVILANEDEILKRTDDSRYLEIMEKLSREAIAKYEGIKIIILPNVDDLLKRADNSKYLEIKEKLIGRTLVISAEAQIAIVDFLKLIHHEKTASFLNKNSDEVIAIHSQSKTSNLRILKQALWDFEYLSTSFSNNHWEKDEAIKSILRIVLALSFEMRAGRLNTTELVAFKRSSRISRAISSEQGKPPTKIDQLEKRYPDVDFDQTLIGPDLLNALLFDGRVDSEVIQASLNSSRPFITLEREPAWKRVLQGWTISDEEFEGAVAELETQFMRRDFSLPGEVFLVFGIRLFLVRVGFLASKEVVLNDCKSYLNDLRAAKRLRDKYKENADIEIFHGWEGYAYLESDTPQFTELLNLYRALIAEVAGENLPQAGKDLLGIMAIDQTKYLRMLIVNTLESSRFYDVPVLATIEPDDFVNAVMALEPSSQSTVFSVFKTRYTEFGPQLTKEKEWLRQVKLIFEKRIRNLPKMSKYRIETLIHTNIEPYL